MRRKRRVLDRTGAVSGSFVRTSERDGRVGFVAVLLLLLLLLLPALVVHRRKVLGAEVRTSRSRQRIRLGVRRLHARISSAMAGLSRQGRTVHGRRQRCIARYSSLLLLLLSTLRARSASRTGVFVDGAVRWHLPLHGRVASTAAAPYAHVPVRCDPF